MKLEDATIAITLSAKEWAALCVEFVLADEPWKESAATANLAKLKILQAVYSAVKSLGGR